MIGKLLVLCALYASILVKASAVASSCFMVSTATTKAALGSIAVNGKSTTVKATAASLTAGNTLGLTFTVPVSGTYYVGLMTSVAADATMIVEGCTVTGVTADYFACGTPAVAGAYSGFPPAVTLTNGTLYGALISSTTLGDTVALKLSTTAAGACSSAQMFQANAMLVAFLGMASMHLCNWS